MKTAETDIYDIDALLDKELGAVGTPERAMNRRMAEAFFTGQIIEEARKRAGKTQSELADRIGTNKTYISRVETGRTEPRVGTFYRIAAALGLAVKLTTA